MSCSINYNDNKLHKWIIPNEIFKNIYPKLYLKDEVAGKMNLHIEKKTVINHTMNKGFGDSVEAPKAIVNYHTHPIPCYIGEKTVYGWPSGEDMRESILFGIEGSIAHVVPSVEGIYVIQVNPCILENLCNLDSIIDVDILDSSIKKFLNAFSEKNKINIIRGIIVQLIEIYFRSTHAFRTYSFVKKMEDTGNEMSQDDFITYTNAFKIENVFKKKEISECKNLKCNKIWVFENNIYKKMSFEEYCKSYEYDEYIYSYNINKLLKKTNIKFTEIFKCKPLIKLIENIQLGSSCKYPEKLWNEEWFRIWFSYNEIFYNNQWIPYNDVNLTATNRWEWIQNEYSNGKSHNTNIRLINDQEVIFYFFNLSGKCTHEDIKENIISNESNENDIDASAFEFGSESDSETKELVLFGSNKCKFCNNLKTRLDEKGIKYKLYEFGSIKEAIEMVRKYTNDESINTIPVLLQGDKKIDHTKYY